MTHNTSIPNQNFSILCLFLAEISIKYHLEDTSLKNMTHNTYIPNQNFSILCLFLAEISMKYHLEDTSLSNMTHNTYIPNQTFSILCLFLAENSMKFHSMDTSLRHMTQNTSFSKSKSHEFLLIISWNWVWNFIQMIHPWEIWHIKLLFQIKISQFCAYSSLNLE